MFHRVFYNIWSSGNQSIKRQYVLWIFEILHALEIEVSLFFVQLDTRQYTRGVIYVGGRVRGGNRPPQGLAWPHPLLPRATLPRFFIANYTFLAKDAHWIANCLIFPVEGGSQLPKNCPPPRAEKVEITPLQYACTYISLFRSHQCSGSSVRLAGFLFSLQLILISISLISTAHFLYSLFLSFF